MRWEYVRTLWNQTQKTQKVQLGNCGNFPIVLFSGYLLYYFEKNTLIKHSPVASAVFGNFFQKV
jgi:hypothetical protein